MEFGGGKYWVITTLNGVVFSWDQQLNDTFYFRLKAYKRMKDIEFTVSHYWPTSTKWFTKKVQRSNIEILL